MQVKVLTSETGASTVSGPLT